MRKVLSFVLVLSLVLGSFSMAFAATTPKKVALSDIDGLACEDAVRVLSSLDVVSGYDDGTYKPEQTVTRAEMASLLIKSLGLKETDAVPKFTDSQNHWAKGYIAYANTLGIISGRSATVFDPDATVTYDEATTMIIKALGYTDDSLNGTYPASYVSRAKVLGILDGITTGSGGANRGDIAVMLYQALDQAIGKVDKDGNFQETVIEWDKSQSSTQAKKYDTMLERLGAKIHKPSDGYRKAADEAFIIDGTEDAVINIYPYRGALVSAYENKDGDIIAIKEVFSTFVSGTIDKDVLKTADGTEYDLKTLAQKNLKINGQTPSDKEYEAVGFKNGDVSTDLVGSIVTDDDDNKTVYTLAADVSGKKLSEVYSVAHWNITKGDVLESDDITDIEKNHKLLGIKFDEDNNGDIDKDTVELVGVDSLDDIKAGMVAYVYQTTNGDKLISRVAVGNAEVKGEITKATSDNLKLTIDGKQYKYAAEELKNNGISAAGADSKGRVEAGDTVAIKTDAYGYIYSIEKSDGQADKFAVVLGKKNGNDLDDPQVKLFLADGSVKTFDVKVSDVYDDNNNLFASDTANDWEDVLPVGTVIKYGVNKDGRLTSIFDRTNTDEKLKFEYAYDSVSKKGYYDGKEIAKDAVIINYDGKNEMTTKGAVLTNDSDDYAIVAYDKILDGDDVVARYVYDEDDNQIAAILLGGATTSSDTYGVIVDAGTNGSDAGGWFEMLINGDTKEYDGDKSLKDTKSNQLYKLKFDADGAISDFDYWYNSGDKVRMASIAAIDLAKHPKLENRTFSYDDEISYITYDGKNSKGNDTAPSVTLDKNAVVYVYDATDKEWQVGSLSDLRNMEDQYTVYFYDIEDEDGIYDVVMIDQNKGILK